MKFNFTSTLNRRHALMSMGILGTVASLAAPAALAQGPAA